MKRDPEQDLELLIRSRYPLLVVDTWEEDRLEEALRRAASKLGLTLRVWTSTSGLKRDGRAGRVYDSQDPMKALANLPLLDAEGVWLFKDLQHYLDRPEVVRRLRDLCRLAPGQRRSLVLVAPHVELPAELEKLATRVRLALPDEAELRRMVQRVVDDVGRLQPIRIDLDDATYRRLLEGLRGLTRFEAERAVTRALLEDSALTASDVEGIQEAKRELLAEGGIIEYVPPGAGDVPLGGLAHLRAWLEKRRRAFTPEAKAFGLEPPKGVILLGVQGCGKTLAARTVARTWGLPLLKLEPGRLYAKYIGESERNLEVAIRVSEAMAPCVLLIDEIEKGFASTTSAEADGGLSRRILGRLLGWLQEREAAVFVVATSNDVNSLPPEMLRKGRFDEIFFVDLPDADERQAILEIHLRQRARDPAAFDLARLAAASEGFSGAELEQAVVAGLYTAFAASRTLDTETLAAELGATRPLSVTRREAVEALRRWARERAVAAN